MSNYIPLILFTVLTNATAQILLKRGMLTIGSFDFDRQSVVNAAFAATINPFVIAGLFTFVVSMTSHLVVLSRVDLSFAYPFLSLAYVVTAVYSFFIFQEDLNGYRIVGIALICAGTALIARS